MSFIVAIDGPAGTGKGTMAGLLAKKYKLVNIDTGRQDNHRFGFAHEQGLRGDRS